MKLKIFIISIVTLVGCQLVEQPAPQPEPPQPQKEVLVWQGEFIVDAKDTSFQSWSALIDHNLSSEHVKLLKVPTINNVRKPVPYSVDDDLCLTDEMEGVSCSPNYVVTLEAIPNDDRYDDLWGMKNIKGPALWDIATDTRSIKIAVLDTGINHHEDLANNITGEYNVFDGTNRAADGHGHGTHVSGTICASGNNSRGVVGVSWRCRILAVKVLSNSGYGSYAGIINGLDWSVSQGARVINLSLGGGSYSQPMFDAIQRARDAGALLVAAAGNSSVNNDVKPHYPSSYELDNIVAVASIDDENRLSTFSNYGKSNVDLAAPGTKILSTFGPSDEYRTWSGTSMATPHVSGVAAIIASREPHLHPAQIRSKLLAGVRRVSTLTGFTQTGGTLDGPKAVNASPGAAPTPTPAPCDKKKLKKCNKKCIEKYKCAFRKQRRCREVCAEKHCPTADAQTVYGD